MSDNRPLAAGTSLGEELESALAEPEPMCLVQIDVDLLAGGTDSADDAKRAERLAEMVEARLIDNLRRYDQIRTIEQGSFVMIMRTLADATVLEGRMDALYQYLSAPYGLGAGEVEPSIYLGAAIRVPQEDAESLLQRLADTIATARVSVKDGPVIS